MKTPGELIQLMRLSGTGKVRALLEEMYTASKRGPFAVCYQALDDFFSATRRDSEADAWPAPGEPTGILCIKDLRIGMRAEVIHPEYAVDYREPVEITGIELHYGTENITVLDSGFRYDGWQAKDLLILPSMEAQK